MARKSGLHLGIDATNIRQGGGITHLSQLLGAGDPIAAGISQVTVWAGQSTVAALPERPWLSKQSAPWMEAGLPRRIAGQQLQLPRSLVRAGCHILFSPGGTLPWRCSVPTITMSQNMLPFEPLEARRFGKCSAMRLKLLLLRHVQSRSLQSADGVIFLTQYARSVIARMLGSVIKNSALIPHGVGPRFFHPPRPQRQFSDYSPIDPFRALYVSILMPYKHQAEVACAAAILRVEGLPIEMTFIGAPWGDYGRKFVKLLSDLDPKREFLHWAGGEPFETIHGFYQHADAFVFASTCENLPNILIEAMAAGLPIAGSDRGPVREILGDSGLYFDAEAPNSIADSLRILAMDVTLRQKLADLAWRRSQLYSWERCASETFAFIAHVARQSAK